ncbi:hypothetical protein HGQ41_001002 [Enterococcus faecalis]|uniref:hypothetical protein n=1 Tax=Enterococcus faecalis TaxID=1351 RepID=UPI0001F0B58F|nr:hypothetical protein [Enterococcus faecalis]EFU17253.1 hypothetical protein HMPREF9519_01817 [Enterococcus faecalis TX1346]EGO5969034.1 hypothetical protein [Enterococcus faecalis]EHU9669773.1 hypothetical protein [Enterococcus faecalis]EHV0131725.1 hypothetical protein [Enterococcus faecalis]EHV0135221.1 hypothetical protein [Enterococcus faecalis]
MNVFDVIGIVAIPVAILCFHNWIIGERLSEAENRINSVLMKQMNSRPTFQDSRTGAVLPTRQQAIPPHMKTKTKSVLNEHETEMVKEVVLEKIDVLKNNLQFMQSNQRKHNSVYTLNQLERQLNLYERIYKTMSDDDE